MTLGPARYEAVVIEKGYGAPQVLLTAYRGERELMLEDKWGKSGRGIHKTARRKRRNDGYLATHHDPYRCRRSARPRAWIDEGEKVIPRETGFNG